MVFNEGSWKIKDIDKAVEYAEKLIEVGNYFPGFNRSGFVGTMIGMFKRDNFNFKEFIHKLSKAQYMLTIAPNRAHYKIQIENVYNYRRKNKVNLRF